MPCTLVDPAPFSFNHVPAQAAIYDLTSAAVLSVFQLLQFVQGAAILVTAIIAVPIGLAKLGGLVRIKLPAKSCPMSG